MSGTSAASQKTPKSNPEWARKTEQRVDGLENPTSVRVGDWTVSTADDSGNLIGSNVNGGSVVIAEVPTQIADPDEIQEKKPDRRPYLRAQRRTLQATAVGIWDPVQWDTLTYNIGGWANSAGANFTQVTVPVSGLYVVNCRIMWRAKTASERSLQVVIDGVPEILDSVEGASGQGVSGALWPICSANDTLPLNAGQAVEVRLRAAAGDSNHSDSGLWFAIYSSLSLACVEVF